VKWHSGRRQWTFDTGGAPATLTFGYLKGPYDKFRYASSEFQLIAFDELTELAEDDYLFLFSRVRRTTDMPVPLRIRSASNPGNIGHLWVKQRFIGEHPPAPEPGSAAHHDHAREISALCPDPPSPQPSSLLWHQGRAYVPSRIADNPSLPEGEYRATLSHLPPLVRERLMNGDWDVQEEAQFKPEWLRYFHETTLPGGAVQLELLDAQQRTLLVVPERLCRRFITVDPAGTSAEKAREARGRPRSWTVAQVWDQPRRQPQFLLLRHQVRKQVSSGGILQILRKLNDQWRPEKIWIENEVLGKATIEQLEAELRIEGLKIGTDDKLARAAPLLIKFEDGQVFLPRYENSWRPQFERELLAWTGHPDEPADQIDAAAYAARIAQQHTSGTLRIEPPTQGVRS
jgi:phage terminase large subunit-like protein